LKRDSDLPAHDRILTALRLIGHDRPEVVADFARSVLRRVDPDELRLADAQATARRLIEAFESVDRRGPDEIHVTILRPPTTLDGRKPGPTVIEASCQDRPFLLSTLTDEMERRGFHVVRAWHPIVGVRREEGRIVAIEPARTAQARESIVHLEVSPPVDPDQDEELTSALTDLLIDVFRATGDFHPMRERLQALASELRDDRWPGTSPSEAEEAADLVDWLLDGNLLLLGVREYAFDGPPGEEMVQVVAGSGLGLLSDESRSRYTEPTPVASLSESIRKRLPDTPLVTVTRSTRPSTVQRRIRMEYFAFMQRADDGRPKREVRVLGLFTRSALAQPARSTPILREKLRTILEREDVVPSSHDEGNLIALFQALPKDELFQADVDTLQSMLLELLHAERHGELRTLIREDERTSMVSVVIAVPRDRYSPQLRARIQSHLLERFAASKVDVELSLGDRQDAVVRFLLHVDGDRPEVPLTALRSEIRKLARSWLDDVRQSLRATGVGVEAGDGSPLARRLELAGRLPRSYQDAIGTEEAVEDLSLLDELITDGRDDLAVALRAGENPGTARLRAAKRGVGLELSSFLPILESLGLIVVEEVPHRLLGDDPLYLHDFGVRADVIDVERDGARMADLVLAAWRGHAQVDALNELVLVAGLEWREVSVLRAYRRLRRQLGTAFTPEYVNETMVNHPEVARALIGHFRARFDPEHPGRVAGDPTAEATARQEVVDACDALTRLDHDRILRSLLELMDATLRTNAFRPDSVADGTGEPYLAFKLDPARITDTPRPVPYREIFVQSPRVEGVHLRGGAVARGGLRWSDRRDDVRSEVADLVKAQVLKNGLIVPTGAKGGFVLTHEPADPTELRDEVRRQYLVFVRGLLDVTDDLDGDTVVPPPKVVRQDADDPYLVVAADRGTATFSDTANALAARYGFWLGDAFASGGSNGYDHKKLGVTAKGAWLTVRRHFRELGIDVQSEPVTVAGVGDMSGDVFGNGLLRSRAVRLVAAFDHRDIFLDPDPDPEVSFQERQRLFDLPRSSWQDYDRELISAGGGVFPRSARSVELSKEVQELLRVDADTLTPPELISAILRAPVDLLFAGGIGNYVKASTERNEDIGDRANDELRVDANDLRARVVGEGANLFITQRGRIEYARRGGRINQDAIDNAAGVSTSDHEVNLKILLSLAQDEGRIDQAERDQLLQDLADEVVEQVMAGVELQAGAISRELPASPDLLDAYDRMMDRLAQTHDLDRDVEVLPSAEELAERRETGAGLTRPSLASLLAWAKRELKEQLLDSEVLDLDLLTPAANEQFPAGAVERFGDLIPRHRLRRELIATSIANDVVDRMGIVFVSEVAATTGVTAPEVVLAYRIARHAIDAPRWWDELQRLEAHHDPERVLELHAELGRLVTTLTTSVLSNPDLRHDPAGLSERLRAIADDLQEGLLTLGTPTQRRAREAHARWLTDDLIEDDLARFLAGAHDLTLLTDISHVVEALHGARSVVEVTDAFLRFGDELGLDQLEELLGRVEPDDPWSRRQRDGVAADLRRLRRVATLDALRRHPDMDVGAAVRSVAGANALAVGRARAVTSQVTRAEAHRLDAIAVAVRAMEQALEPRP
jgi:glutamate dehydrogenase